MERGRTGRYYLVDAARFLVHSAIRHATPLPFDPPHECLLEMAMDLLGLPDKLLAQEGGVATRPPRAPGCARLGAWLRCPFEPRHGQSRLCEEGLAAWSLGVQPRHRSSAPSRCANAERDAHMRASRVLHSAPLFMAMACSYRALLDGCFPDRRCDGAPLGPSDKAHSSLA